MTKITSPRFHIRCHANAWWLSSKFAAITWFGRIYFNCDRATLERAMNSPAMLELERHEHIHILQAKTFKTRYLGFYLTYLFYWAKNIFRYGFSLKAYEEIPFEREAYANEHLYDYPRSHWKDWR